MSVCLLDPRRGLPPRYRSTDLTEYESWTFDYYSQGSYISSSSGSVLSGVKSTIYDCSGPRNAWKSCVHDRVEYSPACFNGDTRNTGCDHDEGIQFFNWSPAAVEASLMSDCLLQPQFQEACKNVAVRWVDQLYQLRQEPLPDMVVFLAEINELGQLYGIVQEFVRHLILLASRVRTMRKTIRSMGRYKSPKWKRKIREYKKESEMRIRDLARDLLGMRFGVKQPIRDISTIIASVYQYLDAFNFSTHTIHVREQFSYAKSIERSYNKLGPNGTLGCGGKSCWNQVDLPEVEDQAVGYVSATTKLRPQLDGTKIEKLLALLLRQFEMVPSPDVIWELTPLSWLVDYFLNTQKLMTRLMDSQRSFAGVTPIIFDTSVALKLTKTSTSNHVCDKYASGPGAKTIITKSHYERLVGKRGTELLDNVSWLRTSMRDTEAQNSIAYLLQHI